MRGEIQFHTDAAGSGVRPEQGDHFAGNLADVNRVLLELAVLQQRPHPLNDGGGALVVLADVVEDLRNLHERRGRIRRRDHQPGLCVSQDRAKGLGQLVGDRPGQLPHRAASFECRDVRQIAARACFAHLQFHQELRGAEHAGAQLVAHHRDHPQIQQAEDHRRLDLTPDHGDRGAHACQQEELHTAPDHHRRPSLASPPRRNTGVRDKDQDQQRRELTQGHRRIGNSAQDRDGFAEKPDVLQAGGFRDAERVHQHEERAQATGGPCEPEPWGAKVERHHPGDRRQQAQERPLRPFQGGQQLGGCRRPHRQQFAGGEDCHRDSRDGEEEVDPGAVVEPDQRVDRRQRQAG